MKLLHFAPERILVEQLRLLHANVPVTFATAGIISLLLVWVLSFTGDLTVLAVWSGLVWVMAGVALWFAGWYSRSPQDPGRAPSVARTTVAFYAGFGALWGVLPWLALDAETPSATMMVMSCFAGMTAGGLALMSPVLPVFLGYVVLLVLPLAAKLLLMPGPEHVALGLAALLYVATLSGQASKASQAFRLMIELRFANDALLTQLREEHGRAQAAREEAEQANRAKSKFLAAASHDLRQPVHAQGLFLEVLARTGLTAHQQEVLANARSACAASGDMLNTLLDFSRIEAGVMTPAPRPFHLQHLLHKIEVELAPQADAKGLVYRARDTWAVVQSDPALAGLILRNLVSNAIRYTGRGGVLVGCRRRGDHTVVEVRDTGIGIAPEHHEAIFQEFHQLGNPERDRRKGLGLGLAIARGLARSLGHELTLTSRPGRGSVFRLALPLPLTNETPASGAALATAPHTVSLNALRVLVIDDDESVRSGMLHLLRGWGADCRVAESIEEALRLAADHPPALLISDYRLREQRTGAEAIAALRARHGEALPALLITGDTSPERLREAQACGVPLLHKPVAPADLHQMIMQVMAGRR